MFCSEDSYCCWPIVVSLANYLVCKISMPVFVVLGVARTQPFQNGRVKILVQFP
jgi:hypothetical protein